MPYLGNLGHAGAALVLILVVGPVLALVVRRRWRLAVARREEVQRLVLLAAEEAERAEMEAALAYSAESAAVGTSVRPVCAVCFSPTTTRCSRCKAVRYWSVGTKSFPFFGYSVDFLEFMYLLVKLGSCIGVLYVVPRIGDVNGVELGFQRSIRSVVDSWFLGNWFMI